MRRPGLRLHDDTTPDPGWGSFNDARTTRSRLKDDADIRSDHSTLGSSSKISLGDHKSGAYDQIGSNDSQALSRPNLQALERQSYAKDKTFGQIAAADDDARRYGAANNGAASPEQLADKENNPEDDDFYRPDPAREISGRHRKPNKVQQSIGKFIFKIATKRGKVAVAGGLIGLTMGAGGMGILNLALGPMQFIHLANMLDDMHLRMPSRQQESRGDKLGRYMKHYGDARKDTPLQQLNKTRLGMLSRVFADRFHAKLEKAGFTADVQIEGGRPRFKGWTIDVEKAMPDLAKMNLSPEDLAKNIGGRLGANNIRPGPDGKFYLPFSYNAFGYNNGSRVVSKMSTIAGISPFMKGLTKRHVMAPLKAGWHPIEAAKEKFRGKLSDEQRKAYKERITKHIKGFGFSASGFFKRFNKNGGNADLAAMVDEGYKDNDFDKPKPERIRTFVDRINTKLADVSPTIGNTLKGFVVATSTLTAICGVWNVIRSWDDIKAVMIIVPATLMAMHAMSVGGQYMDNNNPDSDTPEVDIGSQAMFAELLYSKETGTSVFDAASLQAELGKPYNPNNDLPEWQKPGVLGGPEYEGQMAYMQSGWMNLNLGSFCDAVTNEVAAAAINIAALGAHLTGVGTIGNMARAIAQLTIKMLIMAMIKNMVVNALQDSEAVQRLAAYVGEVLSGAVVNPMASGAERGALIGHGARYIGSMDGMTNAGLPLNGTTLLAVNEAEKRYDDFDEKPLFARLFDAKDYRSALGKLIDEQGPTPEAQFAIMSRQFFNLGNSIAAMPMRIFGGITNAQEPQKPYDYGFSKVGWNPKDLDDPEFDDPYFNADRAHEIMRNTNKVGPEHMGKPEGMTVAETYKQRAEYCFGKIIDIPADPNAPMGIKQKPEGPPNEATVRNYPMSVQIGGTKEDAARIAVRLGGSTDFDMDGLINLLGLGDIIPEGGPGEQFELENWPPYIQADFYMKGSDGVGDGTCFDNSLEWKALRFFMFDTPTMNAIACSSTKESDAESENEDVKLMATEGKKACKDTNYQTGNSAGCNQANKTPQAPATATPAAPGAPAAPNPAGPAGPAGPASPVGAQAPGGSIGGSVPVGNTELFVGDYETSDFSQWDNLQTKDHNGPGAANPAGSYSAQIVQEAAQGSSAARFEVRPGDMQAGGERAEVASGAPGALTHEGDERWIEMGVKYDESNPPPGEGWFIIAQWHSSEGSPPLALEIKPDMQLVVSNNRDRSTETAVGTITPGQWHCIVIHATFSQDPNVASVEVFLDGTAQPGGAKKFPTMSDGENYPKFGIYRKPQAATHIVYNDGIRITGP